MGSNLEAIKNVQNTHIDKNQGENDQEMKEFKANIG